MAKKYSLIVQVRSESQARQSISNPNPLTDSEFVNKSTFDETEMTQVFIKSICYLAMFLLVQVWLAYKA